MLRAALLALLVTTGLAEARCEDHKPGARPQNTPRQFVGQTLDEIEQRGWIEIAVYEDFPPYSWKDGATAKGVDVEVGRIIAESLGVEPRFRFVQSGETLEADLLNYVWKGAAVGGHVSNLMMRVPYNSEFSCRVEQVVFTGQYAGEKIGIAYRIDAYPDAVQQPNADGRHPDAPVPSFFVYDPVGVENDSISDFYLTATFGAAAMPNRLKADRTFDDSGLQFNPGKPCEIVVIRGYYITKSITAMIRNDVAQLSSGEVVLTGAAAFKNEPYGAC
jgi:hypothetical protein